MRLVGRRDFVKSLGLGVGATLLTPLARHLINEARGLDIADRRWVLMNTTNGLGQEATERWIPNNLDLTAAGALPPTLEALAPWASKMLVIDYLYNRFNPGQHSPFWASLSVRGILPDPLPPGGSQSYETFPDPTGITVDIYAGERLSRGAPFRTIGWGTDSDLPRSDADLNPVPLFRDVTQAYGQLFGGFDPSVSTAELQQRLERRMSVLDLARPDLARMQSRLAGPEREKLDQVESSIRSLELRLSAMDAAALSCTVPAEPTGVGDAGPHGGVYPRAYSEAMVDLHATAMICRLSNVCIFSPVAGRRTYAEILGDDRFAHDMAHADDNPVLLRLDVFNAEMLATMLRALEAVPEGDGTMADRTLGTWYDQNGGRHHSPETGHDTHPIILIGDVLGHFRTGRHVRFPKNEHATSDAFVSILNGLGIATDTFGDETVCRGPLPGLTA